MIMISKKKKTSVNNTCRFYITPPRLSLWSFSCEFLNKSNTDLDQFTVPFKSVVLAQHCYGAPYIFI